MAMGSPELPGENENSNNLSTSNASITNYGQNTSEDSDNNDDNPYEGYEPIPFGDNGDENMDIDNSVSNDELCDDDLIEHPNLLHIISSDAEIEQQVWSEPRPKELEIELDNSKAEQIMSAMAGITLPSTAIPDWAQGISEERWKQNLLERIRQRKEVLNGAQVPIQTFKN